MGKKNVTFVLTEEIDREIEIRGFLEGKQKSEIVIEALQSYFSSNTRDLLPTEISSNRTAEHRDRTVTANKRS